MRNEAADIVQDNLEEMKEMGQEWKAKAREAGTAAWDATKATYDQVAAKTTECSQVADRAIRENPYVSLGIAFGLGALVGFMLSSGSSDED